MTGSSGNVQSISSCRVCQRSGLPIFPLRYAVTRTDGRDQAGEPAGPVVPHSLTDDSLTATPLPEGQHYTLRLLRSGFLYVFNETRGHWIGHVVTDAGYLIEYVNLPQDEAMAIDPENPQPIDGRLQPPPDEPEFACAANPDHAYPGRCIMIPNADRADTIYLAFSDVAWTKRVWKEHATNENGRRDAMRRISLAQWRSGSAQYADTLDKIGDYLAEAHYHWTLPNQHGSSGSWNRGSTGSWGEDSYQGTAFSFSPFSFHGMKERVEGLKRWADEQAEPLDMTPMLVGLEDPVGITVDLSTLMASRLKEFMNSDGRRWPLATAATIDALEPAIREQAQFRYIDKRVESGPLHRPIFAGPGQPSWEEQQRINAYHDRLEASREAGTDFYKEERDKARKEVSESITPEELKREADDAWAQYRSRLQDGQPEFWKRTQFQLEQERFDQNVMLPLVRVHQAWLTGPAVRAQFNAHFDDRDAESGQAFADTLVLCLQDTQQYGPAFEQYLEWLTASTITDDNLLLRGILLNLRVVREAVNAQSSGQPIDQVGTLPWTGLVSGYQSSTEDLAEARAAPGRLLGAVMAPVLKVMDEQAVRPALIALGITANRKVVHTRVTGHVSDAIDALIRDMQRINPALRDTDQSLLKRKLEIQTRGSQRRMQAAGGGEWDISIVHDRLVLEELDSSSGSLTTTNRAASAVLDYNEWQRTYGSVWGSMADRNTQLGIVSLAFGTWALMAQAKAMDEATADGRSEAQWRFEALVSGAFGSVADTAHAILERSRRVGGRLAQKAGKIWRGVFRVGGKLLGFAAAAIMVFWDGYNAFNQAKKGNIGLAFLYGASAIAGAGAFIALTILSATGIGIVLAAAAIVVNIFIASWSNNELQDWMEKCYFGVEDSNEQFSSLKAEIDAFEVLTDQ
ncbi:T6SS effector BTH_I2691 family protein [Chromohalobacter sp. 11-W]|uniref:T6SS effector BTH_I2691 family protein n=1 Tax=Chromohalobacter sp. 11-W TaxID=2994061 RepID=UPI0024691714|nr:T6SS effector BTH_I2691 family protein [Chromohalobacter sp. 11-W]